ncbi:MAG: dockerin type I repeat-containing protein [Clostridiales bacterium]|nr:dockerin type I repeat-containing protein [Clostridiales bacterium]
MNMKKILSVLLSITMVMSTLAFSASALTQDEANSALESAVSVFDEVLEKLDVAGDDGKITAADARATLLYSAGLSNSAAADVDGDGSVTAIDARMLLRYAAGLESVDYLYTAEDKLAYFNAIINSIKPNGYKYYACVSDETVDVTYDNADLVESFNSQINALMSAFGESDTMDFGAELTSDAGSISYTYYNVNSPKAISNSDYYIKGDELASYLTTSNITAVEYKENQSYTYEQWRTSSSLGNYRSYVSNEITGLSSITVYIATDAITTIPDDPMTLNHGRAFTTITQETADSIASAGDSLGSLSGLEDFGTFEISSSFKGATYYDSYITIYFNPETGVPVATEHSLNYDIVTDLYMNIQFLASLTTVGLGLSVKGDINLTTTLRDKGVYLFFENADVTLTTAS